MFKSCRVAFGQLSQEETRELTDLICRHGGKTSGNLRSDTNFLVVGLGGGHKQVAGLNQPRLYMVTPSYFIDCAASGKLLHVDQYIPGLLHRRTVSHIGWSSKSEVECLAKRVTALGGSFGSNPKTAGIVLAGSRALARALLKYFAQRRSDHPSPVVVSLEFLSLLEDSKGITVDFALGRTRMDASPPDSSKERPSLPTWLVIALAQWNIVLGVFSSELSRLGRSQLSVLVSTGALHVVPIPIPDVVTHVLINTEVSKLHWSSQQETWGSLHTVHTVNESWLNALFQVGSPLSLPSLLLCPPITMTRIIKTPLASEVTRSKRTRSSNRTQADFPNRAVFKNLRIDIDPLMNRAWHQQCFELLEQGGWSKTTRDGVQYRLCPHAYQALRKQLRSAVQTAEEQSHSMETNRTVDDTLGEDRSTATHTLPVTPTTVQRVTTQWLVYCATMGRLADPSENFVFSTIIKPSVVPQSSLREVNVEFGVSLAERALVVAWGDVVSALGGRVKHQGGSSGGVCASHLLVDLHATSSVVCSRVGGSIRNHATQSLHYQAKPHKLMVVDMTWLEASAQAGRFVEEGPYSVQQDTE